MKTIYYVRHGESDANLNRIVGGAELESVLTETGRSQAKRAGEDLGAKNIELIVSSPMKRTLETASIIAEVIGYDPEKIITNALFVERRYGKYSNRPFKEYWDDFENGSVHESVETSQEMYDRLKKGLLWLEKLKEENIVLVSHGGAGRAMRAIAEGLHHSHMYKLDGFKNTEIYKFNL